MRLYRIAASAMLAVSMIVGISFQVGAAEGGDAEELPTFVMSPDVPYWGLGPVVLWYGKDTGTFQDAGINVELKGIEDESTLIPALRQGTIEGAGLLQAIVRCHTRDIECNYKIVAVTEQVTPYIGVAHREVVEKYPEIKGDLAAAFMRTTGAAFTCNAVIPPLVARLVHKEHPNATVHCGSLEEGQPKPDVHLKPLGTTTLRTAGVAKRAEEAGVTISYAPGHIGVLRKYSDRLQIISGPEQAGELFDVPINGIIVHENTDPGIICRYMKGYQSAVARWKNNEEEALQYLKAHFEHRSTLEIKLSDEEAQLLYDLTKVMFTDDGTVSNTAMQEFLQVYAPNQGLSVDDIADFSMVPAEGESCPSLRES